MSIPEASPQCVPSSTLLGQCSAFESIGKLMKDPYIQEGCKRLIQEAITGEIVTEESSATTSLTVSEIADTVINVFTKDIDKEG
jgi:hypothetical protein